MRALLVDPRNDVYLSLQTLLSSIEDLTLEWTPGYEEGLALLTQPGYDAGLIAEHIQQQSGLDLIRQVLLHENPPALILLAESDSRELALAAAQAGATDFLNRHTLNPLALEHTLLYATEQAKRLNQLRWIALQFQALLKNSPINIFALDKQGVFTLAEGKYNLFKEMAGKSVHELLPDEPEILKKIERALQGESSQLAVEYQGRIYENWYAPIYDAGGQIAGVIGFSQDITEQRWFEETFQHYTGELEARTRELHAYNYTIAHDLKSPLTMMIGYASLAEETISDNPDEARKFVREIINAGQNMQNMIDQLLQLASEAHVKANRIILDMQIIVERALFRFKYQIETHGIQVSVAPDLPPAAGHAPWVEQIFANLIGNAIKYRSAENPTITIRGSKQNGTCRYEVEDNGMGIAPENQKMIFELFGRVHNMNIEGSGIGLAIVQRMVRKLDGEIGVSSTPGKGSTFWFTLPATL